MLKGVGKWYANGASETGVQIVDNIQMGTGVLVGGSDALTNYPNARMPAVYKIVSELEYLAGPGSPTAITNANRDLVKSVVMAEEADANPSWIARNPTSFTQNGTTHTTTVITALTSTTGFTAGMSVTGSGIPLGAVIVTVDSGTQVTINLAATSSITTSLVFGAYLHSFYSTGGGTHYSYFPDLGNVSFQAAAVANVLGFCTRWACKRIYIDNMGGYSAGLTNEGVIPLGYSSEGDWRARAVLPFISYFCKKLHEADIEVIMSLSDAPDAALGEVTVPDDHNGAVRKRFWTEVAALPNKPDAVFWEYFLQDPSSPFNPFIVGEDAYNHRWVSNQGRIVDAHALGFQFHGLSYQNHAFSGSNNMCRFMRASMLLDYLPGDVAWMSDDPNDATNPFAADLTLLLDPGGDAITGHTITGTLHWAQYPLFTVIVNPTTASDTQTILGVSRTVTASNAVILPNFPSTAILDAFNRVENPLSNGGKWTHPVTSGAGSNLQDDGTSAFSVSGYGGAYWNVSQPQDNEVFTLPPPDSSSDNYLYFRIVAGIGTNVNSYALHWQGSGSSLVDVFKYVAGTPTTLASFDTGESFGIIRLPLGAIFIGPNIVVFSNGQVIGTVTDRTYLTGGYMAIDTNAVSPNGWKNFGGAPLVIPPSSTVDPVVTGTLRQGDTLAVTNGTWDNTPTSYSYQWYRDFDTPVGSNSSNYTTVSADIGKVISCKVTAINASGHSIREDSNDVGPITTAGPFISTPDYSLYPKAELARVNSL